MRVTKLYLHTEQGQIHARTCGVGQPLVLLHTTPGSGLQFDHVMGPFAARGYEVWALDLLGNGRSDPLPEVWSFEQAATTIGQAVDDAGCTDTVIAGGHMAAQIAIELAWQRPQLVRRLIVDGIPMWNRAKRTAISEAFDLSAPAVDEDGGHLLTFWQRGYSIQKAWNPAVAATTRRVHQAVIEALQNGISAAAQQAFLDYDVAPRLRELTVPVLITTAELDTLRDQFAVALETARDALGYVFTGAHPTHCDDRGEEYVDIVDRFVRGKTADDFVSIA